MAIGVELPDPLVEWPNDIVSRGGHTASARLVGQATPHGWMLVSIWGTSPSSPAGDGDGDVGADLPMGRVVAPAAAAWAKLPDAAGPLWLAHEPGASVACGGSWVPLRGVCPLLCPGPRPVWHGPFGVGVGTGGSTAGASPSVRS